MSSETETLNSITVLLRNSLSAAAAAAAAAIRSALTLRMLMQHEMHDTDERL